jgi:hypothetical protein
MSLPDLARQRGGLQLQNPASAQAVAFSYMRLPCPFGMERRPAAAARRGSSGRVLRAVAPQLTKKKLKRTRTSSLFIDCPLAYFN